jgi:hypothetical protein
MKIYTSLIVIIFALKLNSQISSLDFMFLGAKSHKDSFEISINRHKILKMREQNFEDSYWGRMRAFTSEKTAYFGTDVDSIEIIQFHSSKNGAVFRDIKDTVISYEELNCPNLKIFLYVSNNDKLKNLKLKILNDIKNTLVKNKIKWSYLYEIESYFKIEDHKSIDVFNFYSRSIKMVPYLQIILKDCEK